MAQFHIVLSCVCFDFKDELGENDRKRQGMNGIYGVLFLCLGSLRSREIQGVYLQTYHMSCGYPT